MAVQYISYTYYGASPLYDNYLGIHDGVDGAEVYSGLFKIGSYTSDGNGIAVDQEGNTYIMGFYADKILKLDNEGNVLLEVDVDTPCQIAIAPNGSLYTFDRSGTSCSRTVRKRSLQTLEVLEEIDVGIHDGDFWGMAFDSNGYLYMMDHNNDRLEKWNVSTGTRVGTCDFSGMPGYFWAFQCSIAIVGTKILVVSWASAYHFYETDTDLNPVSYYDNTDLLPHEDDESLLLTSLDNTYFIYIAAINAGEDQTLFKLNADLSVVWQAGINKIELGLGAYTYGVAVYDYPLAPVVFPAKQRHTSLKEDCKNFEESMADVCLVFNHNVNVTRRYLQETYGDITHPESSNLRYILPSQQLGRLSKKDLTTGDYNEIITNFMTNVSGVFNSINENNRLVKQWLDDYEPDELGHDFTDVKMRPVVVDKDLAKTMNELFEGIIDNVTVLNMNLEVLKERF